MTSDQDCKRKSGHFQKQCQLMTSQTKGGKTHLQDTKYRTRKDTAGLFNQNLYFFSVIGASYYKKAVEEGGGEFFFFFHALVWRRASFLVTPLPERLHGGNTASGCPCPSLSLIIFIVLAFSYVPSCVSRSLVPTLSFPSLFVSAAFFAQSVAAVQASH